MEIKVGDLIWARIPSYHLSGHVYEITELAFRLANVFVAECKRHDGNRLKVCDGRFELPKNLILDIGIIHTEQPERVRY